MTSQTPAKNGLDINASTFANNFQLTEGTSKPISTNRQATLPNLKHFILRIKNRIQTCFLGSQFSSSHIEHSGLTRTIIEFESKVLPSEPVLSDKLSLLKNQIKYVKHVSMDDLMLVKAKAVSHFDKIYRARNRLFLFFSFLSISA